MEGGTSMTDTPRHRRARTDYPDGVVAILDSGKRFLDRYTVVYTPYFAKSSRTGSTPPLTVYPLVNMSADPFRSICMHSEAVGQRPTAGWGTNNRVMRFEDLSDDCQLVVRQDLEFDTRVEQGD